MKSTPLFLSLCLFLFGSYLYGQDNSPIVLHNNMEKIKPFKKLILTFDLKEGEDLIFDMDCLNGKLKRVKVESPNSALTLGARRIKNIERQRVSVNKAGIYTFQFKNTALVTKNVFIKILKSKSFSSKDSLLLDDVIFSSHMDTFQRFRDDTVAVPELTEVDFYLHPALNYLRDKRSDSCVTIPLIEDTANVKYQYAAYWIGFGNESLKAYNELKQNPPPYWLMKGINEPLIAYGLGYVNELPVVPNKLLEDIVYEFSPNPVKQKKVLLAQGDSSPKPYGKVPISKASTFREFILCLQNFNTITGIPIHIKVAKFQLRRSYESVYLIRERVQEIFIQRSIRIQQDEE